MLSRTFSSLRAGPSSLRCIGSQPQNLLQNAKPVSPQQSMQVSQRPRSFASKKPRRDKKVDKAPPMELPDHSKGNLPQLKPFGKLCRDTASGIQESIASNSSLPDEAYMSFIERRQMNLNEVTEDRMTSISWNMLDCEVIARFSIDQVEPHEDFMSEDSEVPQPDPEFVQQYQQRMAAMEGHTKPPEMYELDRFPTHAFEVEIQPKNSTSSMKLECMAAPWGQLFVGEMTVGPSKLHFESLNPALKENLLEYWYHLGVDHVFASFVQGHSMELRGQNMAKELKPFHSFFVRQS